MHHTWTFSSILALQPTLSNKVHVPVIARGDQWHCNTLRGYQMTYLCTWKSSIKSHHWQQQHLQILLSGDKEAWGKCLRNKKRKLVTELDISIHWLHDVTTYLNQGRKLILHPHSSDERRDTDEMSGCQPAIGSCLTHPVICVYKYTFIFNSSACVVSRSSNDISTARTELTSHPCNMLFLMTSLSWILPFMPLLRYFGDTSTYLAVLTHPIGIDF